MISQVAANIANNYQSYEEYLQAIDVVEQEDTVHGREKLSALRYQLIEEYLPDLPFWQSWLTDSIINKDISVRDFFPVF